LKLFVRKCIESPYDKSFVKSGLKLLGNDYALIAEQKGHKRDFSPTKENKQLAEYLESNNENRLSPDKKGHRLNEEKGTSLDEKGHKSMKIIVSENQQYKHFEGISPIEKGHKSVDENPTKLPNKKLQYLIYILLMLGLPLSVDELMALFDYKHKGKFRQNYLNPLETVGFIRKTNPDKPTASNQKYLITEQGKRFLTGKDS